MFRNYKYENLESSFAYITKMPNAFRIELMRIAIRIIGATHLMITVNKLFHLKAAGPAGRRGAP